MLPVPNAVAGFCGCRKVSTDDEGGESSSIALDVTEHMHDIPTFLYLIHPWIL